MNRKTLLVTAITAFASAAMGAALVALLLAPPQSALALSGKTAAAAGAPTVMTYQGYLTDAGGAPINDVVDLHFRIYTAESGGTMVWEEAHTDITVADGYFSVLLGSVELPLSASVFSGTERWIQVSVDTDPPLPRHRIAVVPYALQAQNGVPAGAIMMWSGSIDSLPDGWALCDGSNGTPDLRNRFIVGAGSSYSVGATGGEAAHILTINEMPSHNHGGTTSTDGAHTHTVRARDQQGSPPVAPQAQGGPSGATRDYPGAALSAGDHNHTISSQGGGAAHENRPPYYALAYIMKLP